MPCWPTPPSLAVAGGGRRPWTWLPDALLVDTVGLKVTVRCGRGGAGCEVCIEDLLAINGVDSVAVELDAIVVGRRCCATRR